MRAAAENQNAEAQTQQLAPPDRYGPNASLLLLPPPGASASPCRCWPRAPRPRILVRQGAAAGRRHARGRRPSPRPLPADRQTTSFIDYSTEAGILLGGNGAPRAMPVSLRTLARSSTRCYSYPVPYPPTPLTTHPFGHSLHSLTRLPSLSALALKSLFSNEVDDVALCPPSGPLPSARF